MLHFCAKNKSQDNLIMGFKFLIYLFWRKGFSTTLLSIMPVCTCRNLLSKNLKAYNYMEMIQLF